MFKKFKIKPKIQMFWDSDYFALSVLEQNQHWSMLPDFIIERSSKIKTLSHPKGWNAPYKICLLWNKQKAVEDLKKEFVAEYPF